MTIDEAYEVLGLDPGVDYVTAHRAYRARARSCHPDTASPEGRAAAADEMARVNAAWSLLRDELRAPALGSIDPDDPEDRAFWAAEPEAEPPAPRTRRRLLVGSAAALLAVAGVALATSMASGEDVTPQDYVGACLTGEGAVVECGDGRAEVEVSTVVDSPEECDGITFSDATGESYFCAVPVDA